MQQTFLHTPLTAVLGLWIALHFFAFPAVLSAQDNGGSDETDSEVSGVPKIYNFDTRTAAMGDATVADATYLTSININPAGISFVKNLSTLQTNINQNWENNSLIQNITAPLLAYRNHTAAVQFGYHHDGLKFANISSGNSTIQPDMNIYQMDVAYAYSIHDILSVGILNNVSLANNSDSQYWSSHITLGLLYAPSESISYGVAFRGIGRSTAWTIVPDGRTALSTDGLTKILELGATLHFPVDTDRTWLSLSLANEKRFGESGIWYKGGLEVFAFPWLALRTGVLFHLENRNNADDNTAAPRFGIGFRKFPVRIDYAISPSHQLPERFHKVGISFDF